MILIYVKDKALTASKTKRNDCGEQVAAIKDPANLESVLEKLIRQYKCTEVVKPAPPKPKRIVTAEARHNMSEAAKKRKWSDQVKNKIAASRKGKGNHRSAHGWESKMMISESMKGNTNAKGLKWCYNPVSLEEHRVEHIPYDLAPRRPPFSISKYK